MLQVPSIANIVSIIAIVVCLWILNLLCSKECTLVLAASLFILLFTALIIMHFIVTKMEKIEQKKQ